MRTAGVGYQRRDPVSHRRENMARRLPASVISFKKTGNFKYVKDGSGHRAGENWGTAKNIDPYSHTMRYSKNSPSFDAGVWYSKQKRKVTDMARRMERGEKNVADSKFIPRPEDYKGQQITTNSTQQRSLGQLSRAYDPHPRK